MSFNFDKYKPGFNKEIKELEHKDFVQELNQFPHHGPHNNILQHSLRVAFVVYLLCLLFRINPWVRKSAVVAALLHDCFGFNWHNKSDPRMNSLKNEKGIKKITRLHVFNHGNLAVKNVERYIELNPRQEDAIRKHMFPAYPIPPRYVEGWLLTVADKVVATKECLEAIVIKFATKHGVI